MTRIYTIIFSSHQGKGEALIDGQHNIISSNYKVILSAVEHKYLQKALESRFRFVSAILKNFEKFLNNL